MQGESMKTAYFELFDSYPVSCKAFEPENGEINRVIIGVHGFAGDKESSALEAVAEEMVKYGTALVCFDFPSHGESAVEGDRLSVENCISNLLSVDRYVTEKYGCNEKIVFATSFGGYISVLASEKLGNCRFILRAPAVTMGRIFISVILGMTEEEFREKGSVICGFERKIEVPFAFYEDLKQNDAMKADISQQTLVIHGTQDDVVPFEDVRQFSSSRKNVRLEAIEGADHRFKKSGELERVVELAKEFILG